MQARPGGGMAAETGLLQDDFTVELHTPTGQLLPCIKYDGMHYFVGEPGQEFVVAVSMVNYTKKKYRVTLRVDGQDPGYGLMYHGTNNTFKSVFQGWLTQSGTGLTYSRFLFGACRPVQAAATVDSPDILQAGKIELRVVQVEETGERKQTPMPAAAAGPRSAADRQKLPEDKKGFLAPGLKAEAGSIAAVTSSWNTAVLKKVGELPSLHVRYDSSEALYLRKALNPRSAPHRAILRQSANPAIAALGAEPEPDPEPAAGISDATRSSRRDAHVNNEAAAAAAGGGHVKHAAPGAQRERGAAAVGSSGGDEYVPRSATAADRIDLTETPVRPMCVNGRRVAREELAVCDLCHDVDGTPVPKWQVNKKQHVKVSLCTPV